ncbi:hypothetical protein EDD99_1257 [Streptomyces sp. 846.5]|nr:hypothetical protein EDD99_1257 [Streptomyces sp. 846.5]
MRLGGLTGDLPIPTFPHVHAKQQMCYFPAVPVDHSAVPVAL